MKTNLYSWVLDTVNEAMSHFNFWLSLSLSLSLSQSSV